MRFAQRHAAPITVGTLVLIGLVTVAAAEDIDTHFDVEPGQVLELDFSGVSGDLDIEGWDQNRVQIQGRVRGHRRGRGRDEESWLEFDQSKSGIEVYADAGYHDDDVDARLTVNVPKQFDVRLRGAVETTVTNLDGNLELQIGNADVKLRNVHGRCRIGTANGKLDIEGCTLDGDISNTNGRLTIEDSDIVGDVVSTNSNMTLSRAPQGLDAKSTNGNIRVEAASNHFYAKTTNGNVTIAELDGSIDTETVNGNVKVRMVGDPNGDRTIEIETMNGDVDVEIPADFSMDFDIEVRDEDRDGRDRYEIVSDFDIKIEADDPSRGRRRRVLGTGSIGGGRNSVRIRATNGDVYLRKAR